MYVNVCSVQLVWGFMITVNLLNVFQYHKYKNNRFFQIPITEIIEG